MRRLDKALAALAEQDAPISTGTLIDRLELGLRGGAHPVLVDERYTPPLPQPPWWRRGPVVAIAAAIVIVVAVGLPLLLIGDTPGPATTVAPATTGAPAPTTSMPAATTVPPSTTTAPPTTTTTNVVLPAFESIQVAFSLEIVQGGNSVGTFEASGPAANDGLICPTGNTFEDNWEQRGPLEHWETRFVCADGTGSFSLSVTSIGEWTDGGGSTWVYETTWEWVLDKGSRTYADIAGSGVGAGTCPTDGPCDEQYSGSIERSG